MSNLNHKGPENLGPRTGKQSGNCKNKTSDALLHEGNRHCGKGRRRKLNCNNENRLEHEKNCCSHNN